MYNKKFILITGIIFLFHLITWFPAYGKEKAASILSAENNVQVDYESSGNWEQAYDGMELYYGTQIRTMEDSRVMIIFTDGTQMKLDSNTVITVEKIEGQDDQVGIIELIKGTIWSLIRPVEEGGPPAMEIESPTSVCSIRGTELAMTVGEDGQNLTTTLTVITGEVELQNQHGKSLIPASCQSIAYATEPPTEAVKLTQEKIDEVISWIDFGNPRVMVLVEELNLGKPNLVSELESEINLQLTKAHYHIIDPDQLAKIKETDEAKKAIMGDELAAATLGKRLGYDVVVTGRVETMFISEEKTDNQTFSICEARSDIKVVISDTAQLLFTQKLKAEGQSLSKEAAGIRAMENISTAIAEELVWEIPLEYVKCEKGHRATQVIIENCSFEDRGLIIEHLKTIKDADGKVYPRSFENSIAIIDVEYKGTSEELVYEIIKITDINLEVTGLSMNKIQLKVTKEK